MEKMLVHTNHVGVRNKIKVCSTFGYKCTELTQEGLRSEWRPGDSCCTLTLRLLFSRHKFFRTCSGAVQNIINDAESLEARYLLREPSHTVRE